MKTFLILSLTFFSLTFFSLNTHADSLLGRWIHSACYRVAGADYIRHELFILPGKTFLRQKSFKDSSCQRVEKTEDVPVTVRRDAMVVTIDNLDYELSNHAGPLKTYLSGIFASFTLIDDLDEGVPQYDLTCPDFTGDYVRLNDGNFNKRKMTQKGCEEIFVDESTGNIVTAYWRKNDLIIPNRLQWHVPVILGAIGHYTAYFSNESLIRLVQSGSSSYDEKYIEKHYFTKKADKLCGLPNDGQSYLVIERRLQGQSTLKYCHAYRKVI